MIRSKRTGRRMDPIKLRSHYTKLLFRAVHDDRIAEVKHLLLKKRLLDLDAREEHGRTLLHANAMKGYGAVTRHLLRAGCNIEAEDADGNRPLHQAVMSNNESVIRYLVKAGASLYARNVEDNFPLTLALMIRKGNLELIEMMIDECPVPRKKVIIALTLLDGLTKVGNVAWLNQLSDCVANLKVSQGQGFVPLHWYALAYCHVEHLPIARALFERDCDAMPQFNGVDVNNAYMKSPLHCAAINDYSEVLKFALRTLRLDVDQKCSEGKTPLHYACKNYKPENIKLLLKWGANVNAIDKEGNPPILYAVMLLFLEQSVVEEEQKQMVRLLLEYKAVIFSEIPLKSAIYFVMSHGGKNIEMAKIFVEYVAKMDEVLDEKARERTISTIEREVLLDLDPELKQLYDNCRAELTAMIERKISETTVSFFDLLTDEREVIARYAGNQGLVKAFESSDHEARFPIYSATLKARLDAGCERKKLFDTAATVLSDALKFAYPSHAGIQKILRFLSYADVDRLADSV